MSKRKSRSAEIYGRFWSWEQRQSAGAQDDASKKPLLEQQAEAIGNAIRKLEHDGRAAAPRNGVDETASGQSRRKEELTRIRARIHALGNAAFSPTAANAGSDVRGNSVDCLRTLCQRFNALPDRGGMTVEDLVADYDSVRRWAMFLRATHLPYRDRLSDHSLLDAWHIDLELQPWEPPRGCLLTRRDTYGWKPQVRPYDGRLKGGVGRSVGEVEVVCRLRTAGFRKASWTDGFGGAPEYWSPWIRRPPALTKSLLQLDARVRAGIPELQRNPQGGWPDVVAYRDPDAISNIRKAVQSDDLLFVEYKGPSLAKPNKRDAVSKVQTLWLTAAVEQGLIPLTSYVVVRWTPSPEARVKLDRQWAICDRPSRREASRTS